MASQDVSNVVEGEENVPISKIFNRGMELYSSASNSEEPTNSKTFQKTVADAISCFESVTHMVSSLGLFSINESVDEVSSEDLQYLQLPALLGCLTQKRITDDRSELLRISEAYYRDYLTWCKCYGLIDNIEEDYEKADDDDDDDHQQEVSTTAGLPRSLITKSMTRDAKIRHYKEQKDLDKELSALQSRIDLSEEIQRHYYKKLLRKRILQSQEELENIKRENNILKHMSQCNKDRASELKDTPMSNQPLKPVLIVKDKMQKQVYGLGYPSLPVMSIEEFYEQKLKEFGKNPEQPDSLSLMERALAGVNRESLKEQDAIDKENAEERDDVEALNYTRDFDDWKDVNRRGCGNRKNMG